jgi:hypothetical protein
MMMSLLLACMETQSQKQKHQWESTKAVDFQSFLEEDLEGMDDMEESNLIKVLLNSNF